MLKPVIFCVDDEKIILESLKAELRHVFGKDYLIETAESAAEAIETVHELVAAGHEIPVVISDYIMPMMNGDALLYELHTEYPNMIKIMLTGQATMEGVTNAINQARLYRYIPKPWEQNDLILTVREALKSYYHISQLEQQNTELKELSENLEEKVELRTAELEQYKLHLEALVAERTHELEHEISVRKDVETEIRQSLKEREILLREVYHRTKNNMTVIISLLKMQAREMDDDNISRMFELVTNRIMAMATVHELLYQREDLDVISLPEYVRTLVSKLQSSLLRDPQQVSFHLESEAIDVTLEQAIPLGLTLNEIITNALIHGFKDDRQGTIKVAIARDSNTGVSINIANDGAPFSEDIEFDHPGSLGLRLIKMLIEEQLKGSIGLETDENVRYTIEFEDSSLVSTISS